MSGLPEELEAFIESDGGNANSVLWHEDVEQINFEIVGTTRWSVLNRAVFKYKDRLYAIEYDEGATEYQEASGEYEAYEVMPIEKIVIDYVRLAS